MYLLFLAVQAIIMFFQLRSLLQSSDADYYHPITQAVIKLTEPALKLLPKRGLQLGPLHLGGFICALFFTMFVWIALFLIYRLPIREAIIFTIVMYIKTFGYLIIGLLLIQALCSWLPSTRGFSFYIGQITAIITRPVQKIIPPIGMIDISLMVVLIAIFALNRLFLGIFGIYWLTF